MTSVQSSVARTAADHPGLVKVGRLGWLAKGVVYLVAGFLALFIVTKSFGWSESAGSQEFRNSWGAAQRNTSPRGRRTSSHR